jgi:uncharacterized protein (DUF983 family)
MTEPVSPAPISRDAARFEPHPEPTRPPRARWQAMKRGWSCHCPACGKGRLFARFLKVAPACDACGEDLHHHRADDLPAYLTIFIVGHLIVWLILIAELEFAMPIWAHVLLWPTLTLGLSLLLIQPIKGAVVGLQWAQYMHGFGGEDEERLAAAAPGETTR